MEPKSDFGRRRAVVVGAGFVGMATALYLQRDGWEVTVADPNDPRTPGDGASSGNAGLFAVCNVTPLALPGMLFSVPRMLLDRRAPLAIQWPYLPRLLPWLFRFLGSSSRGRFEAGAAALSGLLARAIEAYQPLLAAAGAEDLVRHHGVLFLCQSARSFAAAKELAAIRRRHGVRAEILGPFEARQMVPELARDAGHGVLYPDVRHTVNPSRLLIRLAESFAAAGGSLVGAVVTGFDVRGGGLAAVRTNSGDLEADLGVVAAGAWSKPLARGLGAKVPLDTERGYHVTVADPGFALRMPIISGDYAFGLTPMEMGLRIAGTVEFAGLQRPPARRRIDLLLEGAKEILPGIDLSSHSTWMGFRPSLPDSLPVIGPTPTCPQVYFAFGHGHLGLTSAAATGEAIADALAGRRPKFDLTPFRAERFAWR